jgi:hypothetical protein
MHGLIHVAAVLAVALSGVVPPSRAGEFVASTPCGSTPRAFLGIAAGAPCERITWHLTMSSGSARGAFTLRVRYGMTVPNTEDLAEGGTTMNLDGEWTAVKGATSSGGATLRLTPRGSPRVLHLRTLHENLLHLLDERDALLVGTAGWSYTLNRRDPVAIAAAAADVEPARAGDTDAGVFDGRTPCQPIAALVHAQVASGCAKLKWSLTLRRDASGRPGDYTLEGTLYRDRPRTGRWSIEQRSSGARTIVIRLDPQGPGAYLSFLKADDNVLLLLDETNRPLVGNTHFSFTLNRAAR